MERERVKMKGGRVVEMGVLFTVEGFLLAVWVDAR